MSAMARRVAGGYTALDYPRWAPWLAFGLLWLGCQAVAYAMVGRIAFPLDDGYIVLHNARTLVAGDDNFTGVWPLSGSTSLLHTLGVVFLFPVLSAPAALWVLSWLGILAAGLGFDRLARNLGCGPGARLAVVAGTLLAGEPLLILLNGLETGWAIAAIGWALALAAAPRPGRGLAVLCGLLPFVRPELGALGALLMVDQARRRYVDRDSLRAGMSGIAADFLVLMAVSLPLLALQWLLSGGLIPNAGVAKQYFFGGGALPLLLKLKAVLKALAAFSALLGPVFLSIFLVRTRIGMLGIAFMFIVLAVYTAMVPDSVLQNNYRYLYIFVPVMAANLAGAVTAKHPGWRAFGLVFLALGIVWNLATLPATARNYATKTAGKLTMMAGLAGWIEANLDRDELVLIHDIGYVAYATAQPLYDLVGIKSPRNIEIHKRYIDATDRGSWAVSIEQIAVRSGARVLVVSTGWEPVFGMASGLRNLGWTLTPLSGPGATPGYYIYRIAPPEIP